MQKGRFIIGPQGVPGVQGPWPRGPYWGLEAGTTCSLSLSLETHDLRPCSFLETLSVHANGLLCAFLSTTGPPLLRWHNLRFQPSVKIKTSASQSQFQMSGRENMVAWLGVGTQIPGPLLCPELSYRSVPILYVWFQGTFGPPGSSVIFKLRIPD